MHVPKSSQGSFSEIESWLYPDKIDRVRESWAGPFREHILPMLLDAEKRFADLYSKNMGAPNKPVSVILGILILKEMNDLTDLAALQEFEFSMQWHYALDINPNSHICEKTLFNFRNRIMNNETLINLYNDIVIGIIKKWSIKTGAHRVDSTVIKSNMKILGRLGLFLKTIRGFLKELKKQKPGVYAHLNEEYKKRYVDREGYFADVKPSQSRCRLRDCAKDLCELVNLFHLNKKVRNMKSFNLMERLLEEQVHVNHNEDGQLNVWLKMPKNAKEGVDSENAVALKNPKELGGEALQNPSDPDVTYSGHKGPGYKVQISETCHKDNPFQIIDSVSVEKANESDQGKAETVHKDLSNKGIKAETTFVDAGYVSGENIVKAKEQKIELVGPLPGNEAKKESPVLVGDFEFNETFEEVESCPGGHAPVEQEYCEESQTLEADFDAEKCETCPHAPDCPTKKKNRVRKLKVKRSDAARSCRRREEKTKEFKEKYKIRSGIEATISHLKNDMGMKRLNVRGSPSVNLQVIFKTLAHNIRQVSNYALGTIRSARKTLIEQGV